MATTPVAWRSSAAVALAATSGATDAIAYLALGHVFTSAMTGNLVLLGISLSHQQGERLSRVLIALCSFIAGCAIGTRVAGRAGADDELWPRAVSRGLTLESAVLACFAAQWWTVGGHPSDGAQIGLLGTGALALGVQSATMHRFGPAGLNTTFFSGALMRGVIELAATRSWTAARPHLSLLLGLICGGSLTALVVWHARDMAPIMQLVPLGVAIILGLQANRSVRHAVSSA
ncbi:YoaK family protein [Mycolicibacterium brisbanense]|uniref:Putative membrane protein n=1 Tax=Mycolicibacterium brisbanense TaxID=146020 RepID=A0A100VXU9_9MYCO|nr:YoaK family protein [Mycolicibacterium brisbanense]MCV7161319.1 DUF1275 domain-containing protein [Mycolicibacterium brisbanense]GAS87881.1 putative membrane protein [Mycolicibacterium brisbanense]